MNTPQHARINTALALAIIVAAIGFAVYVWLMLSAIPAHGQTITPALEPAAPHELRPVLWFIAENNYAAPVASSCEAPAMCKTEQP